MIEEYGTIIEVKDQWIAVVQCAKHSACNHCPSAGSCHLGDDSTTMIVEAYNQVGAGLHDYVKLVTTTRNFLQSSFLLYIVPIIALLIGAGIGQALGMAYKAVIDPSLLSALLGTAFLIVSFLGLRYFTRNLQREKFMPTIVSVSYQADPQGESI